MAKIRIAIWARPPENIHVGGHVAANRADAGVRPYCEC